MGNKKEYILDIYPHLSVTYRTFLKWRYSRIVEIPPIRMGTAAEAGKRFL